MERLKRLIETIRILQNRQFSGSIKINFSQGSLGRVEQTEEFEEAAVFFAENNSEKTDRDQSIIVQTMHKMPLHKAVSLLFLTMFALNGCATPGAVGTAGRGNVEKPRDVRIVEPGDNVVIQYLCRLKTGEVVAATDEVMEGQPKSNIYLPREQKGPISVVAVSPGGPQHEKALEEVINDQLAGMLAGMKEGERREVALTAQKVPMRNEQSYVLRLPRVRTRPKEMKVTVDQYRLQTGIFPQVGEEVTRDPAFPGLVEAVTDQDVIIRFSAKPGSVVETPFGPGRIREEDNEYKVDIDARKGALVRTGPMIGRIADVDDKVITVDYRYFYGGETIICDVEVERVEKTMKSAAGE